MMVIKYNIGKKLKALVSSKMIHFLIRHRTFQKKT